MEELIRSTIFATAHNINDIWGFPATSVGQIVNTFVQPVITLAGFVIFFFFLYAGFKYLTSGGNKEELASARAMMINSIIGFIIFMLLFIVIPYVLEAFSISGSVVN